MGKLKSTSILCNQHVPQPEVVQINIKPGEILTDLSGQKWKLGKKIGLGAFGEIYVVSFNCDVKDNTEYVAKIESHSNGPLFVEINCYLRIAKQEMINEWKEKNNSIHLGMPHYVASGSHCIQGFKYRFLIIPRFNIDLETLLKEKNGKLSLKTVLLISLQLIDVLQYIHSKGYVHADIKASNVLLAQKKQFVEKNCEMEQSNSNMNLIQRNNKIIGNTRMCKLRKLMVVKTLKSNGLQRFEGKNGNRSKIEPTELVYLLDYGLATKYLQSNGQHKHDCIDQRKAHAGTILFCSIDAHKGSTSRRSDLESLGYNIIYWLTSTLPWCAHVHNPTTVEKKKQRCMADLNLFLKYCFIQYPKFLLEYFTYLKSLEFCEKPDYNFCKKLFKNALDNLEGINKYIKTKMYSANIKNRICSISRSPLKSNLSVKLSLRKKNKKKILHMLNWSKILMDPEIILKQGKTRDRKLTECCETSSSSLSTLNISELNPTSAMVEVYTNYINKTSNLIEHSSTDQGDTKINGYTSAMMKVYIGMQKKREFHLEKTVLNNSSNRSRIRTRNRRKCIIKKLSNKTRTWSKKYYGASTTVTRSKTVLKDLTNQYRT